MRRGHASDTPQTARERCGLPAFSDPENTAGERFPEQHRGLSRCFPSGAVHNELAIFRALPELIESSRPCWAFGLASRALRVEMSFSIPITTQPAEILGWNEII